MTSAAAQQAPEQARPAAMQPARSEVAHCGQTRPAPPTSRRSRRRPRIGLRGNATPNPMNCCMLQ
eukprot:7471901-Heterocapsa_arctica.AAC.1